MNTRYDESWFKSVLDSLEDFILVKGDKSKLLWANKAFLNYYGMSEEDLYNIVDAEHSDPDDTLQYVRDDKFVFDNNKTLDIPSEPVTDSKGTVRYYHTIKTPIRDSSGDVIMSVGVSRLIKDHETIEHSKEARQGRKEIIQFQREFISKIKVPCLFLDAQGGVVSVNESFANLFELKTNSFSGFTSADIFPFWHDTIMSNSQSTSLDLTKIKMNNISRQGDLTISPWMFGEGEFAGHLVLFKDRTEELKLAKRIEEEKQKGIISDRLKSLGVLSAGVAHEINNPLAIIVGNVDRILLFEKDNIQGSGVHEALHSIKEQSMRISKIIKGLKSLSRDGTFDKFVHVNIIDIVNDAFSLCEGRIKNIGIKIEKDFSTDAPVYCKPGQISQVVLNLINNSIDEIKNERNSWIKVSTSIKDQLLVLNITDSGQGIREEVLEQMFDPFFTTKEVGEGTGLGLGISLDIIRKHKGELFYNADFENTTFTIHLPVIEGENED